MLKKILIVEDEQKVREIIKDYFSAKDFEVIMAPDGMDALDKISENEIDIVLLDIMMPELDGFAVCRKIRAQSDIPVIFLTAVGSENNKLTGYDLGADDYITKPFSLALLHAKINALLNRVGGRVRKNDVFEFPGLTIYMKTREVFADGNKVYLTPKEYDLLIYLIENKNCVLSRDKLLSKIWGYGFDGEERVIDTHIKNLRKILGKRANCIKTVFKVGYKFVPENNWGRV